MQSSPRALVRQTSRPLLSILNSKGVKRIFDVAGALFALIIFSPVLVICAVAIRLGGASSVIFRQERIGQGDKPFRILKLTTMKSDAHLAGPLITAANDTRLTPVGRIVRPPHLDELTQFINVLRGDMSIVGPRPSVAKFVEHWPPAVRHQVLSVRPGITGLATLFFHNEGKLLANKADVERAYVEEFLPQRLSLDLWYVNNRTLGLDIRILALTLIRCLGVSRLFPSSTSMPAKIFSSEDTASTR